MRGAKSGLTVDLRLAMGLGCLAVCLLILSPAAAQAMPKTATAGEEIDLGGAWRFRLDPAGEGLESAWWRETLDGRIELPGTTDLAGVGDAAAAGKGHLTRPHAYIGAAWYQRDIHIPQSWRGRRVELFLERCLWETRVWLDGRFVGAAGSLATPHRHRLGALAPGDHVLTVRVDNSLRVNIGTMGHSYTEETQSIWNGMVGRLELRACAPAGIESLDVFPDPDTGRVDLVLRLHNDVDPTVGDLELSLSSEATGEALGHRSLAVSVPVRETLLETSLTADRQPATWDEFDPALYRLQARFSGTTGGGEFDDRAECLFGFRRIERQGRAILLNGRTLFLRGTVECCVFPRTGHPPMDEAEWGRILGIVRAHGMNHVRFHSWCPPEAAFRAADRAGIYLQVESPFWIDGWMADRSPSRPALLGRDAAVVDFIRSEMRAIVAAYGNHPSFTMLAIGNEMGYGSDYDAAAAIVKEVAARDPRRLHAVTCARVSLDVDDYFLTHQAPGGPARGVGPPHTDWDFSAAAASTEKPLISHENGQRPVYPDLDGIAKYTGPLKPLDLESFRDGLAANGLLERNADFTRASGLLALLLYKHEIEAIARTPGMAGFQLLQLNDFTGQGEALVGLLDPFWDSKGVTTPEEFRTFCGATVPLARFAKFVWERGETFRAGVELAHHGPRPLRDARIRWSLAVRGGRELGAGMFEPPEIATGGVHSLGDVAVPLDVAAPAGLEFSVAVDGTPFINRWNLWLFPPASAVDAAAAGVFLGRDLDDDTRRALASGARVLLVPLEARNPRVIVNRFQSLYWSFVFFPHGHGTLGLLIDDDHPALAAFPTGDHSDWQWRDLADRSRAFVLDGTPRAFEPIVQPVDTFHRNHKLGAIFETRVGAGRLLVCGFDIVNDLDRRPAASQLRRSLLDYMASDDFAPELELPAELLEELFHRPPAARTLIDGAAADGALLDVRAAARLEALEQSMPWRAEDDDLVRTAELCAYRVAQGGAWKDAGGAAWHGNPLEIELTLPPGSPGTLAVHVHDWNDLDRRGSVVFEGREYLLGEHTGAGEWLAFDVMREDLLDGKLSLTLKPDHGPNIMVTRVVFLPSG